MITDERYAKIVEITNSRGFISTRELAQKLNVTETTIRRDCDELSKKNLIIRVHGGAKSIQYRNILSDRNEKNMKDHMLFSSKEKNAVARRAASIVEDGNCIFLDGGTSIVAMLKYLEGKKIKIVTHSKLIVSNFQDYNTELFCIGGKLIPEFAMCTGPLTLSGLERFNFDYAFIGCAGIDLKRKLVYTVEMDTMAIKQKAMSLAKKSYLLADSSKFNVTGFCSFISTDDFEAIFSDNQINADAKDVPDNFILIDTNI